MAIPPWPKKPFIYQINTWVWLDTLSRLYNKPITLENIPDRVLNELESYNMDAIWLMGVWQRSVAARESALRYQHEYKPALPDITPEDVIGSPYAIGAYQVEERFGGRLGMALFRKRLRERGMRLIVDFVPNHVSTDHAWVRTHPEYMVLGQENDLHTRSSDFFPTHDVLGKDIVVAHGRDPHFPGWIDTAQLNAFSPNLRRAHLATLLDIASQCDGVRCDMAMLMLNDVFNRTWGGYASERPATEYWDEIIPTVKKNYPDFTFMAEVYWDMESRLQNMGFDFCYDKRLYDRLRDNDTGGVRAHLVAPVSYQSKLVRFIENHDEQRAASSLGMSRSLPAAVLIATLPGATLLHDGQFVGRKVKLPVQIGRQPHEKANKDLKSYYLKLLTETRRPIYQEGEWWLFHATPGTHDGTHNNLVAHGWRGPDDLALIVSNTSDKRSQGHVSLAGWTELGGAKWQLTDALDSTHYERDGHQMQHPGLYIDLHPFQSHIFHFQRC